MINIFFFAQMENKCLPNIDNPILQPVYDFIDIFFSWSKTQEVLIPDWQCIQKTPSNLYNLNYVLLLIQIYSEYNSDIQSKKPV